MRDSFKGTGMDEEELRDSSFSVHPLPKGPGTNTSTKEDLLLGVVSFQGKSREIK